MSPRQPPAPHECNVTLKYMGAIYACSEITQADKSEWPAIYRDLLPGQFVVGNGEYQSTVNFCPYCGKKAPVAAYADAEISHE